MMENTIIMLIPIFIMLFTIAIIIFWFRYKVKKLDKVDWSQPEIDIPIVGAYNGIKGRPRRVSISHNQLFPKLFLGKDTISYRVLFNKTKDYQSIEKVDIYLGAFYSKMLILEFADSSWTFVASLGNTESLKQVIKILRAKGCALSEAAENLLNS